MKNSNGGVAKDPPLVIARYFYRILNSNSIIYLQSIVYVSKKNHEFLYFKDKRGLIRHYQLMEFDIIKERLQYCAIYNFGPMNFWKINENHLLCVCVPFIDLCTCMYTYCL